LSDSIALIDKLEKERTLAAEEFAALLTGLNEVSRKYLHERARQTAIKRFGNKIYVRGLIEFTNYCRQNCYYCGIRRDNRNFTRYRLSPDEILECCDTGYELGFRTFVLQGGEDPHYTDAIIADIVRRIKTKYTDCAVTLSLGEKSEASYRLFREAGADRYLLRHETATDEHYARLHPQDQTLAARKACLYTLRKLGYQVGAGFMVGSPYQTTQNIVTDLLFIKELSPQMVGIGPFLPHHDTPFADFAAGSVELTLALLSILRLMIPNLLLPATTALGTAAADGRDLGILAGANVLMPNLSPAGIRELYLLYDNKLCTGDEAAESLAALRQRLVGIGYEAVAERGDFCPEDEI